MNQFIHSKLYPEKCWHNFIYKSNQFYCTECYNWSSAVKSSPDYFTDEWIPKLIARLVGLGWERNFGEYLRRQGMAVRIQSSTTVQPDTYFFRFDLISQPRFTTLLYNYLQKGE